MFKVSVRFLAVFVVSSLLIFSGYSPLLASSVLLLDEVTSVGVGSYVYDNSGSGWKDWTCDVSVSDNTTSTVKVRLEGNVSGVTYSATGLCEHTLPSVDVSSYKGTFSCVGLPVNNLRGYLVTNSTGSNRVSLRCVGVK